MKIYNFKRTKLSILFAIIMVLNLIYINPITVKAQENEEPKISYTVHAQTYGWMTPVGDNKITGTTGQSKRLEAIAISIDARNSKAKDGTQLTGGIAYRAHVQSRGWMNWVTNEANGESTSSMVNRRSFAGTMGERKRLEAIQIELTGKLAEEYDVFYRVHVQSYGWQNWCKNGTVAGTVGKGKRLEAIQIKLVKKVTDVSASVTYNVHSQSYGWMKGITVTPGMVSDATIAGTIGKSKRLEAIAMRLNTTGVSGGIKYSTHIQGSGWNGFVADGSISGSTGAHKRMEAIKINLTGDISAYYDVYYRAHVQGYGWLGWAKNGEPAGTEGACRRMEAVQVTLVNKGASAPGPTARAYIKVNKDDWKEIPGEIVIRVNKQMNCVTVYKGNTPIKAMICSTGAATPVGTFYTGGKWRWLELMLKVYGQYSTQIVGDILFHSVPYYSTNIYDLSSDMYNQLGTQCSHGCIRLTVADAKWLYDNCAIGTRVEIYNSNDPGPLGKPQAQKIPYSQTWDPTDPAIK